MSVGLGVRRRDVTGIYRVGSGDSKMPLGLQGHAHMHIGHGFKSDGHHNVCAYAHNVCA